MVKFLNGHVFDAETNASLAGVHVWPLNSRSGGVITDEDGNYSLALDDGTSDYLNPWSFDLSGYGEYVVDAGKYLNGLDIAIYKTDAPAVVKIKAAIKNSFFGTLIAVVLIIVFIKISNRIL
jgi:hypothetical protein